MTNTKHEVVNTRFADTTTPIIWEVCGYIAIALTVAGQVLIGGSYLIGQGCWLVANVLYIAKAIKQNAGNAEITRNLIMTALTAGLMIYWVM